MNFTAGYVDYSAIFPVPIPDPCWSNLDQNTLQSLYSSILQMSTLLPKETEYDPSDSNLIPRYNKNCRKFPDMDNSLTRQNVSHKEDVSPNISPLDTHWWKPLVSQIQPLVGMAKTIRYPEIEVRLGKFRTDSNQRCEFTSGVQRDWFLYHLQRLESSNVWNNQPFWDRTFEFVFRDEIRARGSVCGLTTFIRKDTVKGFDSPLVGKKLHPICLMNTFSRL